MTERHWTPSVTTKPKWGESRRGYLIRCCERNGWSSFLSFIKPMGLTAAAFWRGQNPDRLARAVGMPEGSWDLFQEEHGNVVFGVYGDKLATRRLRKTDRLVCLECLNEDRYQRLWWETDLFRTCPIHEKPLTWSCGCGKPLSWTDPSLDQCGECVGVVTHLALASQLRRKCSVERYWLDRLMRRETALPLLDPMPLSLAVEFVDDVAALAMAGFQPARPYISDHPDYERFRDIAFAAIADDGMAPIIIKVVSGYLAKTRQLTPRSPRAALGWFGDLIDRYLAFDEVLCRCRAALSIAVGFPVHDLDLTEYVHIDTVAADLRRPREDILDRIIRSGRLADCSSKDADVFVPIDLAWDLTRSWDQSNTVGNAR